MTPRHWIVLFLGVALAGPSDAQDMSASVGAGIDAYNRGDIAKAYHFLRAAADAGDSDGEVNLGYLYARGQGVAQNQQESFRLYLSSARKGNSEGMNAVGFKYRYGTGIKVDLGQAVHWFCRAAASGDPRGLNNLGIAYSEGIGVERDIGEAHNLWRQSAERGNPNAMFNLGQSLYFGPEPPLDKEEGAKFLMDAARHGHGGAQKVSRQLGYRGALPAVIDTGYDMRRAITNLPPGKTRDCGFAAT